MDEIDQQSRVYVLLCELMARLLSSPQHLCTAEQREQYAHQLGKYFNTLEGLLDHVGSCVDNYQMPMLLKMCGNIGVFIATVSGRNVAQNSCHEVLLPRVYNSD